MSDRSFGIAAALILLLAASLRFDALDAGLPNPRTRPDELPVVQQLGLVDRGEAISMVIYPNAYVYANWVFVKVALAVAPLLGAEDTGGLQKTLLRRPDRIFLYGRALSALAGSLAVLVVIVLARREWGNAVAVAAGLMVASCFLHARDSHALKPDALLSLTVLLSLQASAALAERASPLRIGTAGLAFGVAMASKYTGLLMAIPLWLAGVLSSTHTGARRLLPGPAVLAGLIGAVVFAMTSPGLVFGGSLIELTHAVGAIVLPDLVPPTTQESLIGGGSATPDAYAAPPGLEPGAYLDRPWYHGIVFHSSFSLWYGIGAAATLLAPFALVWGFRQRRPLPVLAALCCAVQLLVMGLTPAVTARYVTQILPVLLMLEAAMLGSWVQKWAPKRVGLALAATVLLVSAQPLLATLGHNRIASRTDTRVLASQWLASELPAGSRVAFAGAVLMPYGQPTPPAGIEVVVHGLAPSALDSSRAQYLVTHDHPLYFSSIDPQALEALAPRLRRLARFDPRQGAEDSGEPVFEDTDAYYIPAHGFDRVTRPGPLIEIYAIASAGETKEP